MTLCDTCEHRVTPVGHTLDVLRTDQVHAQPSAGRLQWMHELQVEDESERAAVARRATARLTAPPRTHAWCAARSRDGEYFFCDWLDPGEHCPSFSGPGAGAPADPAPAVAAPDPGPGPWTAEIGREVEDPLRLTPVESGMDIDYDLERSRPDRLHLDGNALLQTCLIFGGPGSGKTNLFQHLLGQVLGHPDRPGCLLLDPKGVLGGWMAATLAAHGRPPAIVISPDADDPPACNIVELGIDPPQLGRLLAEIVLAEAGGIDPGWSIILTDLMESGTHVMDTAEKRQGRRLTARVLLDGLLHRSSMRLPGRDEPVDDYPVLLYARNIVALRDHYDAEVVRAARRVVEFFEQTKDEQRRFVRQTVESSLGELLRDEWRWLSDPNAPSDLFRRVHQEHTVLLVSVGQRSPAFQRSLCTLAKAAYQQTVLRSLGGTPAATFSILACDEYAQVATEGRSGLVSDSSFFSLSREARCFTLLALQSLATGRSRFDPSMRDRWEGILGNVGLRVFMRLNDIETATMASEFAGRTKRVFTMATRSFATQGVTLGDSNQMLDLEVAPPTVFTSRLPRGCAFVQGTVDAGARPTATFVQVPKARTPGA